MGIPGLDNGISQLSVDCVLFGFRDGELEVLLVDMNDTFFESIQESIDNNMINNHAWDLIHNGKRRHNLLGKHVLENRSINDTAHDIIESCLVEKNQKIYLTQLGAFGDLERTPVNRVVTIVYYSLVNPMNFELKEHDMGKLNWHKISELPQDIRFDHGKIITEALNKLRQDIRMHPVGFYLLPEEFTLTALQQLYQNILNTEVDTRNFRRKLQNLGLLNETGKMQKNVSHRAAKLYTFDKEKYDTLKADGFEFRL